MDITKQIKLFVESMNDLYAKVFDLLKNDIHSRVSENGTLSDKFKNRIEKSDAVTTVTQFTNALFDSYSDTLHRLISNEKLDDDIIIAKPTTVSNKNNFIGRKAACIILPNIGNDKLSEKEAGKTIIKKEVFDTYYEEANTLLANLAIFTVEGETNNPFYARYQSDTKTFLKNIKLTKMSMFDGLKILIATYMIKKIRYEKTNKAIDDDLKDFDIFKTYGEQLNNLKQLCYYVNEVTIDDKDKVEQIYAALFTVCLKKPPKSAKTIVNEKDEQAYDDEWSKTKEDGKTLDLTGSYAKIYMKLNTEEQNKITKYYGYSPKLQAQLKQIKDDLRGKKNNSTVKSDKFTFNLDKHDLYSKKIAEIRKLLSTIKPVNGGRVHYSTSFSSLMKRLDRINNFALTGRFFGSNNNMFN